MNTTGYRIGGCMPSDANRLMTEPLLLGLSSDFTKKSASETASEWVINE
jgi:hypothetical protein